MIVRPDDLANLCALFSVLGTCTAETAVLEKYVKKSMLIDSIASATKIIDEAMIYGLIIIRGDNYCLTHSGQKLGKLQHHISPQLSEQAKDFLIKKVYLNYDVGKACCSDFIVQFRVDTVIGTFVFDRHEQDTPDDIRWLQILHKVGLLIVEIETAKVNFKYLDYVNQFLAKIRSKDVGKEFEISVDRNEIGMVAEKCALEYEQKRLERNGHKDLSMLVQQISIVDKTAGYDILSFRGTGKNPENQIFIEVKGTMKDQIDFIWTRNERFTAKIKRKCYWIYAFTNIKTVNQTAVGPIRINDPFGNLEHYGYNTESIDVHVWDE